MNWWQRLLSAPQTAFPEGGLVIANELAPPYPTVQNTIDAWVAEREAGLTDPLSLPAVERGVELLASTVAMMSVNVYSRGNPVEVPPRIVDRPDPWRTRYTFLNQTVRSMVETGDCFWYLVDPDPDTGRMRHAIVVPPHEVTINWDEAGILPVYTWRNRVMKPGVDWLHIPLSPRVGELRGTSPIKQAASALWAIEAAELYAAGHFIGAGVPSGVLRSEGELDKGEAEDLKNQWMLSHAGPVRTPAVLSGGISYDVTAADPERSQLAEVRDQGVATVARLLGIPAPLLLVNMAGSSITYANVAQLYGELVRSTVQPLYLTPIETAWSDLLNRNETVRFDLGDMFRIDIAGRVDVYEKLVALGVVDADWVRRNEGIRPPDSTPTLYSPTPSAGGVSPTEVPTR